MVFQLNGYVSKYSYFRSENPQNTCKYLIIYNYDKLITNEKYKDIGSYIFFFIVISEQIIKYPSLLPILKILLE